MSNLLHHLLDNSAAHYPDREAIGGTEHISYQTLVTKANQIAHTLLKVGVKPQDRVGIYLDKSIEAIIAIFGILKTGAIYVPLDPQAPVQRIAYILDNCQIRTLIGSADKISALYATKASTLAVERLILIDEETIIPPPASSITLITGSEVEQAKTGTPADPLITEQDTAYILYTSGSTGQPKGVVISHRAALSFVNWAYAAFQITPEDRVSNHAPLHFDLSIFDIFSTLKAGGSVILVPGTLAVFPNSLADFIEKQRITVWYSVPTALIRLVLYGRLTQHKLQALRIILFAGDVFPIKYLRQLMTDIPQADYYNLYGPTETNVCTYYQVSSIPLEYTETLPIGKPCANSETFILNEQHQIIADDARGELAVSGPNLMTGYWGLQKENLYVQHPTDPTQRLYCTGDYVQRDTDGNYRYYGRRDHMIKSRGYRIELGEIERVIQQHDAVNYVAIIAVPNEEMGNIITAYIVTTDGEKIADLPAYCARYLPKYMLPHSFEYRGSLPETSTGKIDKKRLLGD